MEGSLNYIAVEGIMGTGKTALTLKLASALKATPILDSIENPFLDQFYGDQQRFAFQTQLFFLLNRYRQLMELKQQDLFQGLVVADYLFDKDRIYAHLNLTDDELHLYERIYKLLSPELPRPDLILYLQVRPELLWPRLERSGLSISYEYLTDLFAAYSSFFFHYDRAPILIVNAEAPEIFEDQTRFEALLGELISTRAGRRFYSPQR
jgi:deoxyadenosine/deoxycytidine kinase